MLSFGAEFLSSSFLSNNIKVMIYRTVIFHVVLFGCESGSPTWREERRMRIFENRVLRRIFGSKRNGVTREWRRLPSPELNVTYSSANIFRVIKSRRMS